MRLPSVLTQHDLPLPELQAVALDGELFRIAGAFAPIDEVDSAAHRARAVLAGLPERLIAEQHSAAWIWGVAPPPRRHELCVAIGARCRIADPRSVALREVVVDASEVVLIGGIQVTTPLRTVLDLTRFSAEFGALERNATGALMRTFGFDSGDVLAALDQRRNLPGKRRARSRLTGLSRN